MNARHFAMGLGIVFLLVGVLGFVPGVNHMDHVADPNLRVEGPGTGYLLGLFHVNVLHNMVHLLFGVAGVLMARAGRAVLYCQIVAVAYGALAILGLIPTMKVQYTFGLIPIEGHDVWLHAVIALAAAVFGWVLPRTSASAAGAGPRVA